MGRAQSAGSGIWDRGRAAGQNPQIRQIIEDAELRGDLRSAFDSSKRAYGRMRNGKGPARAIMDDKKVQRELRDAASSLRHAAETMRSAGRKRKSRRGRLLVIAIVGAGAAMLLSEGLRKKVLDGLFGAEEEFEYTSITTPAPAGEPVGASS